MNERKLHETNLQSKFLKSNCTKQIVQTASKKQILHSNMHAGKYAKKIVLRKIDLN